MMKTIYKYTSTKGKNCRCRRSRFLATPPGFWMALATIMKRSQTLRQRNEAHASNYDLKICCMLWACLKMDILQQRLLATKSVNRNVRGGALGNEIQFKHRCLRWIQMAYLSKKQWNLVLPRLHVPHMVVRYFVATKYSDCTYSKSERCVIRYAVD